MEIFYVAQGSINQDWVITDYNNNALLSEIGSAVAIWKLHPDGISNELTWVWCQLTLFRPDVSR